jgi:hypothetical protein
MATSKHMTGTRDEQYNVISVLYYALRGADTCATYLQDAEHAGDQVSGGPSCGCGPEREGLTIQVDQNLGAGQSPVGRSSSMDQSIGDR